MLSRSGPLEQKFLLVETTKALSDLVVPLSGRQGEPFQGRERLLEASLHTDTKPFLLLSLFPSVSNSFGTNFLLQRFLSIEKKFQMVCRFFSKYSTLYGFTLQSFFDVLSLICQIFFPSFEKKVLLTL